MARASILGSICLILGACLGWMLKPSGSVNAPVQNETKQTQIKTVTRTVVKTVKPDGTVIVKEVEKAAVEKRAEVKTKPIPRPDFRLGAQFGMDLTPKSATGGIRLFGSDVWLETVITPNLRKPSSKDITLGLSYEF